MLLRGNMIPCQSREAVVTVSFYSNGILEGYLQHPRLNRREKIQSLSQLILLLNRLPGQSTSGCSFRGKCAGRDGGFQDPDPLP